MSLAGRAKGYGFFRAGWLRVEVQEPSVMAGMILYMAQCEVQRCTHEATGIITLKEREGSVDLAREAAVCDGHREELSGEDAEWILETVEDQTGRHGRALMVGESLAGSPTIGIT